MNLQDSLNNVLPKGNDFQLLHLQSNPCEIVPIITPKKGTHLNKQSKLKTTTIKTQHFFALSHNEKYVLALEIYVYITLYHNLDPETMKDHSSAERLIFVSKADTNGYCDVRFSAKDVTRVILEFLLGIDPNYYLTKVKPLKRKYMKNDKRHFIIGESKLKENLLKLSKRYETNKQQYHLDTSKYYSNFTYNGQFITKISLFTRPADHYLFSESSKNKGKHNLNGIQLMDWWMNIIDSVIMSKFDKSMPIKACLRIPGEDSIRVRKHFQKCQYKDWKCGDIFNEIPGSLAAFNIPLFPDDPKSRFLHQLVEENRIMTTTLKTFWLELQERQEFKLSVLVSVIGVEGYTNIEQMNYLQPNKDAIVCHSLKQFSYLKNYITAEEYDSVEGAIESYCNIKDYFKHTSIEGLISLHGSKVNAIKTKEERIRTMNTITPITILQPRKKAKK